MLILLMRGNNPTSIELVIGLKIVTDQFLAKSEIFGHLTPGLKSLYQNSGADCLNCLHLLGGGSLVISGAALA
jgi:hypothetical protein